VGIGKSIQKESGKVRNGIRILCNSLENIVWSPLWAADNSRYAAPGAFIGVNCLFIIEINMFIKIEIGTHFGSELVKMQKC